MSIKEKITSFLVRRGTSKVEEVRQTEPEPIQEEVPEMSFGNTPANEALLEFSADHPLNRLYHQRRKEAGYLPTPRVCLDEDDTLPPELIGRERKRLQTFLSSVCSARLKKANSKPEKVRKKKKKKNAELELEPDVEPEGPPSLDAFPCFFLSADKLYAWVIVFPPVREGEELSHDMLYMAMMEQGISFGVDTRLADHLSHDDKRYFHLYLIAKGKPAFDGTNGNIVDNYPRVIERVLEVNEYDQVDYTALNLIYNVEEGQEICHLIKPTEGEPGCSVLGEEIPAKSGKFVPLPKGRNTEISEDGSQLLASITGHVEFAKNNFHVKPVLDIPGDVDFSTGDIKFLGDINIQGNILSGFAVQAMGTIHVGGVAEAGSTVEAGGDLIFVKGILGDGRTIVRSRGSVFSKYIENATICVWENIQTDCIIGSDIYCGGEVLVKSGRGSILGSRIWAAKKIVARVVGSQSESKTAITLGGKPCANFEWKAAKERVDFLEMELEKLECQPESSIKSSLMGKAKIKLSTAEIKLQQAKDLLDEEEEKSEEKDNGRLECDIAYPGTTISSGNDFLRLRQIYRNCVAKEVCGEIVIM